MRERYPWAVYLLRDEEGFVRYVGITKNPAKRLGYHVREARTLRKNKRLEWLRSVARRGVAPTLEVVEWTSDWDEAERRWVKQCRNDGCELVNGTDGGKDTHGVVAKSGEYPQIKYVRRQHAAAIQWLKKNRGDPAKIARCVSAYEAMTRCLDVNRKRGRLGDLELVFRSRFRLAPGLVANGEA